jgi:hypothetical protein
VRELVYLSQAKLQQFRKPTSKRDGLSGGVKLTAGLTGLPAVEANVDYDPVAAAAGTTATLDQAEEFIRSKWPVRWWAEEELEPGEWIQFETKLAYGVLTSPVNASRQILFFWGRDDTDDSIQLLLHGSPRHLVHTHGEVPAGAVDASMVAGLFSYLDGVDRGEMEAGATRRPGARVARIVRELRYIAPDETAGWLSGLARVTFSAPGTSGQRLVVASPLVVEHVPAPR